MRMRIRKSGGHAFGMEEDVCKNCATPVFRQSDSERNPWMHENPQECTTPEPANPELED